VTTLRRDDVVLWNKDVVAIAGPGPEVSRQHTQLIATAPVEQDGLYHVAIRGGRRSEVEFEQVTVQARANVKEFKVWMIVTGTVISLMGLVGFMCCR
jgi:hypothetical protein